MSRWLGALVVAALLGLAWLGFSKPSLFPAELDIPRLVWLVMALLLVSGAGYGFWRFRTDGRRALGSLLIWGVAIAAIAALYQFTR